MYFERITSKSSPHFVGVGIEIYGDFVGMGRHLGVDMILQGWAPTPLETMNTLPISSWNLLLQISHFGPPTVVRLSPALQILSPFFLLLRVISFSAKDKYSSILQMFQVHNHEGNRFPKQNRFLNETLPQYMKQNYSK